MKAKFTFQVESTMFDATPEETNREVQRWADEKGYALTALVYIGRKWHIYKTFNPMEAE